MYVVIWLLVFRPRVSSTRSRCSVEATRATINLDGVGIGDVTSDVTGKVAGTIDMMLH